MDENDDMLDETFAAAVDYVAAAAAGKELTDSQLLQLYGFYKQATQGPCTVPKPGFFDRRNRAKWQAWQSCSNLSASQAQQQYIATLSQLVPTWDGASPSAGGNRVPRRAGAGGPVQSRMADAADSADEAADELPELLHASRVGDAAAVEQLLQRGANVGQRGSEQETALHWAADRGRLAVLRLLLASGADLNAVDADGQTPLHYATLAEQEAAAQLLLQSSGIRPDICNSAGESAADLAPDTWYFLTQLHTSTTKPAVTL